MNHEKNIEQIYNHFGEEVKTLNDEFKMETIVKDCFHELGIETPKTVEVRSIPSPANPDADGTIRTVPFTEQSFKNCCEGAIDEDFIGDCRESFPISEAVVNAYCLMWDIKAPTWHMSMMNPFARPALD